jgi:hypothetical protein
MAGLEGKAQHGWHRWWDYAVGGSAMLVSLISLWLAVQHGHTMEKLVKANSWPNIQVSVRVDRGGAPGSARLSIAATNNGVGPARIDSLELFSGNKPLHDAGAIIEAIKVAGRAAGNGAAVAGHLEGASAVDTVLGAHETTVITRFVVSDGSLWTMPMVKVGSAIETRICYCSVLDECFRDDSRLARHRPEHVESCPLTDTMFNDRIAETLLKASDGPET